MRMVFFWIAFVLLGAVVLDEARQGIVVGGNGGGPSLSRQCSTAQSGVSLDLATPLGSRRNIAISHVHRRTTRTTPVAGGSVKLRTLASSVGIT